MRLHEWCIEMPTKASEKGSSLAIVMPLHSTTSPRKLGRRSNHLVHLKGPHLSTRKADEDPDIAKKLTREKHQFPVIFPFLHYHVHVLKFPIKTIFQK